VKARQRGVELVSRRIERERTLIDLVWVSREGYFEEVDEVWIENAPGWWC
jgi:hypothetical protein